MFIVKYRTVYVFFALVLALMVLSSKLFFSAKAEAKNNVKLDKVAQVNLTEVLLNMGMPLIQAQFNRGSHGVIDWSFLNKITAIKLDPKLILSSQLPPFNAPSKGVFNANAKSTITPSAKPKKEIVAEGKAFNQSADVNTGLNLDDSKPQVLIYHTHTHESFIATAEHRYIPTDSDRSDDPNVNVIRLGKELKGVLNKNGISVLHDTTVHDNPYDGAYERSVLTLKNDLKKYPSIKFAIDLHRDAYGEVMKKGMDQTPDLNKLPNPDFRKKYLLVRGGENYARIMFVIGSRRSSSDKEDWHKNYEFAKKISDKVNQLVPGLSLGIDVKTYASYNQQILENSVLVEVGSNYNTLEEAVASAKVLGEALSDVINSTGR